ncbi:MAG TPA: SBBP repeat-containing protein, partial [Verrucomicrobiae bacterium]
MMLKSFHTLPIWIALIVGFSADACDFTWMTLFPSNSSVNTVARDAQNRSVVAGTFSGTASFGTNQLTSVGGADVFIAALGGDGNVTWVRQAGGIAGETVTRVAIARDGTVFFCGTFLGTANFGTNVVTATSSNGYPDLYVARLNSAGEFLWVRTYPTSGSGTECGLALFDTNRVWITSDSSFKLFIRGYDFNGNLVNDITPTPSESQGKALAIDTNGNIYVTGYFRWSLDFGSTNFAGSGAGNAFLAKFTPAGALLWAAIYSPINRSLGYDIALTPNGDVVNVGHMDATYLGAPAPTLYVWKLSANGDEIWLRQQGERRSVYSANSVAIDAQGNIYTFGKKSDAFSAFDPRSGPMLTAWTSSGTEAVFLRVIGAKLGEDGTGLGITVDSVGNAWLAGSIQGTFDFGTHHVVATNTLGFVTRLSPVMHPRLDMQRATNNAVVLSWPASATGFQLRTSDRFPATNWANVGNSPTTLSNRVRVSISATNAAQFF